MTDENFSTKETTLTTPDTINQEASTDIPPADIDEALISEVSETDIGDSDLENSPDNISEENNNTIKTVLIAAIASVIIVVITFSALLINKSRKFNEDKEKQKQIKTEAMKKVDNLCKELYAIEDFSDDSTYKNANNKISEIDKLISENGIEQEKGKKADDVKSYVKDLKVFQFISENIDSADKTTVQAVDERIGSLTHSKVISKLSSFYPIFEENARNILWNNAALYYQNYVFKYNNASTIDCILVYDENYATSSTPAGLDYIINAYGCNGKFSQDNSVRIFQNITTILSSNSWNSICNNGKKAIIVKYRKQDLSVWTSYLCVGYDVKAIYEKGKLLYDVTKHTNGKSKSLGKLTLEEIFNTTVSVSPPSNLDPQATNTQAKDSDMSPEANTTLPKDSDTTPKPDTTPSETDNPTSENSDAAPETEDIVIETENFLPSANNSGLYKVRKSPDDSDSQLGAFESLENAKSTARKHKNDGYKVYDEKGNLIYQP